MKKSTSCQTICIKDLETLKTIADPLRNQIFETLTLGSLTVKQVAEKLGLSPKKLYYHVRLLEDRGLIEVAETRMRANMLERVYRAVASNIEIEPCLISFATDEGKETINTQLVATLDMTREDLLQSLEARAVQLEEGAEEHPRRVMMFRELSRLDEARAREFEARLDALMKEFEAADTDESSQKDDLQTYALTVVYYPRFYYPDSQDQSSGE